ncbi:MAG: sigma-70 family RNA polymerase sigma factor [Kiritimatiellae bacterium]|nr:sigma-70 family RNA polymerase sigma factor [Kiritimatiellia bacterium]
MRESRTSPANDADAGTPSDEELLTRFLADGSQDAFRVLVERHTSMVLGTCRRQLGGDADRARDAAQAVFIVFAQRAGTIRNRRAVASWLFWTARSVVSHMNRAAQRRSRREKEAAAMAEVEREQPFEVSRWTGLEGHLNDAIAALRGPYRQAVVLHFLEGMSHQQAAEVLGCTKGAVAMRVSRAVEKMRAVLKRKGVALSGAALAAYFSEQAAEAASVEFVTACQAAALAGLSGEGVAAGAAAVVAQNFMKALFWAKVKVAGIAAAWVVACGGLVTGVAAVWPPPAPPAPAPAGADKLFQKRYVLYRGKMGDAATVQHLLDVMTRAAAVGYNGLILNDSGGDYLALDRMDAGYFESVRTVQRRASELGLVLIPSYLGSTDATIENRDLAEALPVRDTPFKVANREATVADDANARLLNPGLDDEDAGRPRAWRTAGTAANIQRDAETKHGGSASLCVRAPNGSQAADAVQLAQSVAVTPYRAYTVSVWARTEGFSGRSSGITVLGAGNKPLYMDLESPFRADQPWGRHEVDFNSLDNRSVEISIGSRRAFRGKLWLDDVELREVGLYSTVRRRSLPVTVRAADRQFSYLEGEDFVVEDRRLRIPNGSLIRDGARLKVSWYQRADMTGSTPPASACQPEYWAIHKDNAERVNALFSDPPGFATRYTPGHNGWQVANWDPAGGHANAGAYIAETLRKSETLLKRINRDYELYFWNTIMDPYGAARGEYWLMNGSLKGAWEGVSPATVILNRNHDHRVESLRFFAERGHRQIVVTDGSPASITAWLDAVEALEADGLRSVIGVLYTPAFGSVSLGRGFENLEKTAEQIKARGRWGSGPAFPEEPGATAQLPAKHPRVPFIYTSVPYRHRNLLPIFADVTNLHITIAAPLAWNLGLEMFVARCGSRRILFASNFPVAEPGAAIGYLCYSTLKKRDAENIAFRNMARLIKEVRCE